MTFSRRQLSVFLCLGVALFACAVVSTTWGKIAVPPLDVLRAITGGATSVPQHGVVINAIRVPRLVTAVLSGAALAIAGLQMQTLFRNPLADPFSLGVSSGASLGVALVVTVSASTTATAFARGLGVLGSFGTVSAAAIGSAVVLLVVAALAQVVRTPAVLLIVGVMIGSAVTAFVSLLLSWTDPRQAQEFISWGLGSFSGTVEDELVVLTACVVLGLTTAALSLKQLNALLLGENYARSVGVNIRRARLSVLLSASLLTGAVTAFCGPIGFIGIAVPHAARRLVGTSNHHVLIPATALAGAVVALCCSIASTLGPYVIPINVITSLIGAPIVVAIVLRSKSIQGLSS